MIKSWPNAREAHAARVTWCAGFEDVLSALEKAGAPPPDEIGAAHATWSGKGGLISTNRGLHSSVYLRGPRNRHQDAQTAALNDFDPDGPNTTAIAWAAWLHEHVVPREQEAQYTLPHEEGALLEGIDAEAAAHLARMREEPFWNPLKPGTSYDRLRTALDGNRRAVEALQAGHPERVRWSTDFNCWWAGET